MVYRLSASECRNLDIASRREWLLTNGIGGYAMGTVAGANTRKYHGILVAAINPPADRMALLASIEAFVETDGLPIGLSTNLYQGSVYPEGYQFIESFAAGEHVEWVYRVHGATIRKRVALQQGSNTTTIEYTNVGSRAVALTLRPLVCHRPYHQTFRVRQDYPDEVAYPKDRSIVRHSGIDLVLVHRGARRTPSSGWYYRFQLEREFERGLDGSDDLFCPCELSYELLGGESAVIVASTSVAAEPHTFADLSPDKGRSLFESLSSAANYFPVSTEGRHSLIAGYPWFTDWGRDTMIALPGVLVETGRLDMAKAILESYASALDQGMIPNRFVETGDRPEYNTVDATLWFVDAIYRVLNESWDARFAESMWPRLQEVHRWHRQGTRYGIRVDPEDGLLTQGEDGVQLTWMDAKIDDWVVTPRRGKAIEICGLWIHGLGVMAWMAKQLGQEPELYEAERATAEASFHEKFWKEPLGYYLDVVDPDDASLRPNQVIPFALEFGPGITQETRRALEVVARELLTPVGLRTLAPSDSNYRGRFQGSMRDRDAAYHQGTVWPWLAGPFWRAHIRATGSASEAKRWLKGIQPLLNEYGLGGVAEVYDGDPPRLPGGCPWQAWNVGQFIQLLRAIELGER